MKASKHVQWVPLEVCEQLYSFFRQYAVAREHSQVGAHMLKRIMPQRWSAHYASLRDVLEEYELVMHTLTDEFLNL